MHFFDMILIIDLTERISLQEVIETLVAFSAMAILKEEESNEGDKSSDNSWESWKRGGIIGAAAVTGGALMAITGGMSLIFALLYC